MGIRIKKVSLKDQKSWSEIISRAKADLNDTMLKVIPIVQEVATKGDSAVRELTHKFDHIDLEKFVLPLANETVSIPADWQKALEKAHENISLFHEAQKRSPWEIDVDGNRLGVKYTPVESVAVYAPGGKALYPSSILMGVIPAKIAGVKNISIITPPQKDGFPDVLKFVAKLAGAEGIITVGGAQGIAAVAYGTETIPRAEFVVGPGNQFVTAAKSYLAGLGVIGIDSPAGPSEVLVIADDSARPDWIATDLLSQAEHGEDSVAILVTDSMEFAQKVQNELDNALVSRKKRLEFKKKAIDDNSWILVFDSITDCVQFSNLYAPEHLEIITKQNDAVFSQIEHAGSVFIGPYSPVAMGDYISGTNHILPTAGGSRIYSSLGVDTFLKRVTFQEVRENSLKKLYPYVKVLTEIEGLEEEHGESVRIRTIA